MAPERRRGLFAFQMADSVQFTIALIDKLTGPARQMSASMRNLEASLKAATVYNDQILALQEKLASAPEVPGVGAVEAGLGGGGLATLQAATGGLDEAVLQLATSIDRLEAKLGDLGATSSVTGGLLRGVASALGEKLTETVSDKFSGSIKDATVGLLDDASKAIGEAFASKGGFTGKLGASLSGVTKLLSETLGGSISADTLKSAGSALGDLAKHGLKVVAVFGALAVGAMAVVAAIGLTTVAVGGLAVALGALAFKGATLAIEAAEAKQDTLDMLEAMLGTEKAAKSTYAQLIGITRTSAASKEMVTTAAQELAAAGVDNQQALVGAVRAIAQVESVLKGSGSKIQGVFEKAAQTGKFEVNAKKLAGTGVQTTALFDELSGRTGVGVKQVEAQLKAGKISAEVGIAALTAVIDKRFGGVAAKQALDFPVQIQRLRDNFKRLFDGVNTDGFLKKFSEIVDLFDDSTMAGTAMKGVITTVFNGVFRLADAALPYLKVGLKGLVIIALQIAIAFKPLIARMQQAFGGDGQKGPLTFARILSVIGRTLRFVIGAGVAVATWTPMWKVLGFVIGAAARTVDFLTGSFVSLVSGLVSVGVAGAMLFDWLRNLVPRAIEAGSALVTGLAQGLTNAAATLYETVAGLAGKALRLFKQKFGIASPSKVMMGVGMNLSLGLAQGIKAGAPVANDNMMAVVSPPRAMAPQTATARAFVVNIHPGAVVVHSGGNVEELKSNLLPALADVFEQLMLTEGRGTAAA